MDHRQHPSNSRTFPEPAEDHARFMLSADFKTVTSVWLACCAGGKQSRRNLGRENGVARKQRFDVHHRGSVDRLYRADPQPVSDNTLDGYRMQTKWIRSIG